MKIWITKYTRKPEDLITHMEKMISLGTVKPYKLPEEEWEIILPYVKEIVMEPVYLGKKLSVTGMIKSIGM